MRTNKITATLARAWKPKDASKDPWLRCSSVPGLCLRVRPVRGGWRREWYICYTWHGKSRYRNLGPLEEWRLEDAQVEVRDARKRIKQAQIRGQADPLRLPEPKEERHATMAELAEVYQTHSDKEESTKTEDARKWGHVLAVDLGDGRKVGSTLITDLGSADIWTLRKMMEATPISFNRLRTLLSHAFNSAPAFGLIPSALVGKWKNPCPEVSPFPEGRRENPFNPEQYRALRLTLDHLIEVTVSQARDTGRRHAFAKARSLLSFRLLARTGMRPKELRTMQKSDVRWEDGFADTRQAKGDRGKNQRACDPHGKSKPSGSSAVGRNEPWKQLLHALLVRSYEAARQKRL